MDLVRCGCAGGIMKTLKKKAEVLAGRDKPAGGWTLRRGLMDKAGSQ